MYAVGFRQADLFYDQCVECVFARGRQEVDLGLNIQLSDDGIHGNCTFIGVLRGHGISAGREMAEYISFLCFLVERKQIGRRSSACRGRDFSRRMPVAYCRGLKLQSQWRGLRNDVVKSAAAPRFVRVQEVIVSGGGILKIGLSRLFVPFIGKVSMSAGSRYADGPGKLSKTFHMRNRRGDP